MPSISEWEAQNREEWKRETPFHVTFEFETEHDKQNFLAYMCDGGGEYQAMQAMTFGEMRNRGMELQEARDAADSTEFGYGFLYHEPNEDGGTTFGGKRVKVIRYEDETEEAEGQTNGD